MVRVLFVCAGNIRRSPMAQGVLEDAVRREGLKDEVETDSAGTGGWFAGEPPDRRAQESARRRGVDIRTQQARRIGPDDCGLFDYVLTMDEANYRTVSQLCGGGAVVRPFPDFAPGLPEREVPDPYAGGPEGFGRVLDLVEEASRGLIREIRTHHTGVHG